MIFCGNLFSCFVTLCLLHCPRITGLIVAESGYVVFPELDSVGSDYFLFDRQNAKADPGTNVIYAPGDPIKFTVINAAGQMKAKIGTDDTVRGVIAKGQGGVSGEIQAVVVMGDVVAKVTGPITLGQGLVSAGGKIKAFADRVL